LHISAELLFRDADLLVIEATFLERNAAMATDYAHLAAARAAKLAADSGMKQLGPRAHLGPVPGRGDHGRGDGDLWGNAVAANLDRITG